nr:hypothetical protein [uncultured Albidiferax sp.]
MSGLSDYENWLDVLDEGLYATTTGIRCQYGEDYFFEFSSLRSFKEILPVVKELSLVLLENKEYINPSYLSKRFIRLATQQTGRNQYADQKYAKHDLHQLTLRDQDGITFEDLSSIVQLRFLTSFGKNYLQLSRARDLRTSAYYGPLRIERACSADWKTLQFLDVEGIELVITPNHLVFDFTVAENWAVAETEGKSISRMDEPMRFAIRHHLSQDELQSLISKVQEISTGLRFSNRSFDGLDGKYRFTPVPKK